MTILVIEWILMTVSPSISLPSEPLPKWHSASVPSAETALKKYGGVWLVLTAS